MARTKTEEQKQKIAAERAATLAEKAEIRSKILRVGHWQIFVADEHNIILRKGDTGDPAYYPSVPWELKGLLQRDITDAQGTSIKEVLAAVKATEAKVLAAVACK